MKLRPLHDKIIIKPSEPETQTAGGIFIANMQKESAITEAEVLAVGPGVYDNKGNLKTLGVSVGDKILVNPATGQKFNHEDEEYVTIVNTDIIAVLQ